MVGAEGSSGCWRRRGVDARDRTKVPEKKQNFPCRFCSTRKRAVTIWELGEEGQAQEGPWGTLAIGQEEAIPSKEGSKQFLV